MNKYSTAPFKNPVVFENANPKSSVLIISNGPSTNEIMPYKKELKKYFGVIISVNHGFKYFDDIADYHIVTEKPSPTNHVAEMLDEKKYRTDVPRIINWKGLPQYNPRYNLYKTVRCQITKGFDIRKYKQKNKTEGLLTGPVNGRNMAVGSVTLNSMHFASLIGARKIFLIGADLLFKDKYDHFYNDNQYRDDKSRESVKPINRVIIVKVNHNGKEYTTTDYFRDSAECINNMIKMTFKDIRIYDFSDGLITAARPIKIKDFFNKK